MNLYHNIPQRVQQATLLCLVLVKCYRMHGETQFLNPDLDAGQLQTWLERIPGDTPSHWLERIPSLGEEILYLKYSNKCSRLPYCVWYLLVSSPHASSILVPKSRSGCGTALGSSFFVRLTGSRATIPIYNSIIWRHIVIRCYAGDM